MIPIYMYVIFAYLLGTISFSWIVSRAIKGIDLRYYGSGNLGATNVFRVVDKKWGLIVLFLDALKGYIAVKLPDFFFQQTCPSSWLIIFGIAAIAGHSFPVWLGFRGGKGVATAFGVCLALVLIPTLIAFGVWAIIFAVTRIISIASLVAATIFPILLYWLLREDGIFQWVFPVSIILGAFIYYTHRKNIVRLIKREEKRLI